MFIYIICKKKTWVMNSIHICTAWWLWIHMKLLAAKMSIYFICSYIAYNIYIYIYIYTYIQTDRQTDRHSYIHTYIHTYTHAYIHDVANQNVLSYIDMSLRDIYILYQCHIIYIHIISMSYHIYIYNMFEMHIHIYI